MHRRAFIADKIELAEYVCPRCGDANSHVILPPWLYDEAKRQGYDMTCFVRQKLIPTISSLQPMHR